MMSLIKSHDREEIDRLVDAYYRFAGRAVSDEPANSGLPLTHEFKALRRHEFHLRAQIFGLPNDLGTKSATQI